MRSAQKWRWQGVRRVVCRGTRKERNAASAISGQNPQGAACLGELRRYESGSRRPVLTPIRALHFIPNRTRSHSCFFVKRVLIFTAIFFIHSRSLRTDGATGMLER